MADVTDLRVPVSVTTTTAAPGVADDRGTTPERTGGLAPSVTTGLMLFIAGIGLMMVGQRRTLRRRQQQEELRGRD